MVAVLSLLLPAAEPAFAAERVTDARCGLKCLVVALHALEVDGFSLASLSKKYAPPSREGYSMLDLKGVAVDCGLHAVCAQIRRDDLERLPAPFVCIALLRLRNNHFVILDRARGDEAPVIDPPEEYWLPVGMVDHLWDGYALIVSRDAIDLPTAPQDAAINWLGPTAAVATALAAR